LKLNSCDRYQTALKYAKGCADWFNQLISNWAIECNSFSFWPALVCFSMYCVMLLSIF